MTRCSRAQRRVNGPQRLGAGGLATQDPVGEEPLSAHVAIAGGGTLVLRMANEPGREAVARSRSSSLSLILGSVVLVSLISWWLLSRSVGKPVARLIEAVERVKTDAAELPLGEAGSSRRAAQSDRPHAAAFGQARLSSVSGIQPCNRRTMTC